MSPTKTAREAPAPEVYQLEISLVESEPRIWRRLRVLGDTSLHSLHPIVQHAMSWTNSHLYQFEVGDRRFSEPDPEDDYEDGPPEDARRTRLRDLGLVQGSELSYVYDFGDWWEHRVAVEAVFAPIAGEAYPCCIDGARAGPPDDAGGVHGYAEILSALRDPRHPEHDDSVQWLPDGFDPEAFDAGETTRRIQRSDGPKPRRARRRGAR